MKQSAFMLLAAVAVAGIVALSVTASGYADEKAAPIFGIRAFPGIATGG